MSYNKSLSISFSVKYKFDIYCTLKINSLKFKKDSFRVLVNKSLTQIIPIGHIHGARCAEIRMQLTRSRKANSAIQ